MFWSVDKLGYSVDNFLKWYGWKAKKSNFLPCHFYFNMHYLSCLFSRFSDRYYCIVVLSMQYSYTLIIFVTVFFYRYFFAWGDGLHSKQMFDFDKRAYLLSIHVPYHFDLTDIKTLKTPKITSIPTSVEPYK